MEQRLIDANALKVSYCKQCLKETRNEQIEVKQTPYCAVACQDFDVIDKQPTVDAVPVVHGYNKQFEFPSQFTCSVCGWESWDTYCGDTDTFNYCPNCGSAMDGKEQDDG